MGKFLLSIIVSGLIYDWLKTRLGFEKILGSIWKTIIYLLGGNVKFREIENKERFYDVGNTIIFTFFIAYIVTMISAAAIMTCQYHFYKNSSSLELSTIRFVGQFLKGQMTYTTIFVGILIVSVFLYGSVVVFWRSKLANRIFIYLFKEYDDVVIRRSIILISYAIVGVLIVATSGFVCSPILFGKALTYAFAALSFIVFMAVTGSEQPVKIESKNRNLQKY